MMVACQSSTGNSTTQEQDKTVEQVQTPQFTSIPQELALKIYNEADLLDFIFHNLPFSMSQDQKNSIQANVSYISPEAQPYIPEGCKPIARQFYGSEGDIFLEADVYYSEGCQFYVFIQDGKTVHANKMTPAGAQFFNSMIAQAMNAFKSAQ